MQSIRNHNQIRHSVAAYTRMCKQDWRVWCVTVTNLCGYMWYILLLSIQKMIGGGRPAGGLHCSTRDIPLCTVIGSIFSFDHKGDPMKQNWALNKTKQNNLTGGDCKNINKTVLRQFILIRCVCLTWLTDDNVIGHGRAVLVAGDALVNTLIRLCLLSADVNDQSAWVGLHDNFGILFHIEMSAITCPWKARLRRVKIKKQLRQHACTVTLQSINYYWHDWHLSIITCQ